MRPRNCQIWLTRCQTFSRNRCQGKNWSLLGIQLVTRESRDLTQWPFTRFSRFRKLSDLTAIYISVWPYLQVKADLHSQHFRLSNSFFHYSRLMVWSNQIFDVKTNWILSDRLHEILIKNLEREKNEFKSWKCCECRSALTCIFKISTLYVEIHIVFSNSTFQFSVFAFNTDLCTRPDESASPWFPRRFRKRKFSNPVTL